MTPSLQTQDSVTFGSVGSTPDSSLLFAVPKLRPPRKSLKVVGEDFGTARLKPDDTTPRGGMAMLGYYCCSMWVEDCLRLPHCYYYLAWA